MDLKDPFVTLEKDKRKIKFNKTPFKIEPKQKLLNQVKVNSLILIYRDSIFKTQTFGLWKGALMKRKMSWKVQLIAIGKQLDLYVLSL
jgi:hypothetical protein